MDQYLVIISGVSVFLVISYFLVTILYIAEKKLVSQEDVSININEDQDKSFNPARILFDGDIQFIRSFFHNL